MEKESSNLKFHYWAFLPGSRAELRHDDGRVIATIKSPEIGVHEWNGTLFASFFDAMRTAEKSVK